MNYPWTIQLPAVFLQTCLDVLGMGSSYHGNKHCKSVPNLPILGSDTKVESQRCDEVLADADQRLSQLGGELAQAKQAHEQALLRQQEHASQTERQLEVHAIVSSCIPGNI